MKISAGEVAGKAARDTKQERCHSRAGRLPGVLASKISLEAAGCGFSVSLNDKKELVESLSALASDPQRAVQLGLAGRAAVGRDYNWEHDAAELKKLYDHILPSRGKA